MSLRTSRALRTVARTLMAGSAVVALLELLRREFRNSKLFCPVREGSSSWSPADYGLDQTIVQELLFETDDGELLHAWYCSAKKPIASVVYFHGNSGNLTFSAPLIHYLLENDVSIFLFDYRGFGRSSGRSGLEGALRDGLAAAREHDRVRPSNLPSIAYGYSLGGAVAAQTVSQHSVDGLILQSTFTNLNEITRVLHPGTPIHHLSGDKLDTEAAVASLTIPVLILHGENDEVVPCSMARALYDACTSDRTIETIAGAAHKDLYEIDPARLTAAIRRFVLRLEGPRPSTRREKPFSRVGSAFTSLVRTVRRSLRPAAARRCAKISTV